MVDKSPISILQEHYTKLGLLPRYTSLDESNVTAGPFTFKVEVDGLTAVGSGFSKKQAKHAAASALLKQLKESDTNDRPSPAKVAKLVEGKAEVVTPQTPGLTRPYRPNFVGKLMEYMTKRKEVAPKYEFVSEGGLPHMKQFTMRCIVKDMEELGTGRSKQDAKNVAAEKMWERLQCDGDDDEGIKPKRRKMVSDEAFDEILKKFRSLMDDMGGSFKFEEETPKEYAIDTAGNADDFSKYDPSDRKMFTFLGTRSFASLLPEKTSIILTMDSGVKSHTIGARAWTRRDAMYKCLVDAVEYMSKQEQHEEVKSNGQPEVAET